jgi:hypothetical protein
MRNITEDLFGVKKKSINSKAKGNSNELVVCKLLSGWTGEEFTRIPMSGGLRWKNTANICGDVLCTNTEFDFRFSVETKHLKSVHIPPQLPKASKIYTIWQQCLSDAIRAKKHPLLMLRGNGYAKNNYVIFVEKPLADKIVLWFGIEPISKGDAAHDIVGFKSSEIIVVDFKIFNSFVAQI